MKSIHHKRFLSINAFVVRKAPPKLVNENEPAMPRSIRDKRSLESQRQFKAREFSFRFLPYWKRLAKAHCFSVFNEEHTRCIYRKLHKSRPKTSLQRLRLRHDPKAN